MSSNLSKELAFGNGHTYYLMKSYFQLHKECIIMDMFLWLLSSVICFCDFHFQAYVLVIFIYRLMLLWLLFSGVCCFISYLQAYVSVKRINAYLRKDELDSDNVQEEKSYENVISVENATFSWIANIKPALTK